MTTGNPPIIECMDADGLDRELPAMGDLLHDCVHAGASVNFVLPFSRDDGARFWREKVADPLRREVRTLWVARVDGRIGGTVQLDCDTPPNQPHRAEVSKLMVHPDFRRRGLARLLMAALEDRARDLGRTLITLDTLTGGNAEPLYASLGYETAGLIPDYCVETVGDDLKPTTIMYKAI